ncbi:MAG: YjbE family putative metal transport protein [Rhodospirillales bacterium]|jgi:YjbE family integral membrane protein|nr:YjbE family putative metal transport protein [Rhodospirillales bacterium]MDP6882786.1 YjbE family putative metal transport protein [Rhodospirillales bacterium]
MGSGEEFAVLLTVIGIDLVLSGDNAIVIGTAAARLPPKYRQRAITIGIVIAAVTRMVFALIAFYLLKIVGLLLIGGLLLFWVAWSMWREISGGAATGDPSTDDDATTKLDAEHSFRRALLIIVVADVSMSLDNVLGVVGAARDHFEILVFGLALSIALMGVAANYIARVLTRYPWIIYVGIALIIYVGADMTWRGFFQVTDALGWFEKTA